MPRKVDREPIGNVSTCAIDGGAPPKTSFACNFGAGAWLAAPCPKWSTCRTPPASAYELIVGEKPEGVIRANRTPASVISPAGWGMAGMFSVSLVPGGLRVWLPMMAWKQKLLGSSWNMAKKAACANFVDMFKLTGLDPEDDLDQDTIDSIAIGEAAQRFTRKELSKWHVAW